MSTPQTRVSVSLPTSLVDDLAYLSGRLGVSRSALISQLLSGAASDLRKLLEQVPLNPTPEDMVRFRGSSVNVVRERIESVKELGDDLFSRS